MSVDGLNALSRTARSAGGQTQCRWSQRFVPDSSLRWRSNSTLLARRLCVPPRSPHNPGLRAAAAQSPRTAVASTGLIPCFFRRRWRTRRCRQPAYLPVPLTLSWLRLSRNHGAPAASIRSVLIAWVLDGAAAKAKAETKQCPRGTSEATPTPMVTEIHELCKPKHVQQGTPNQKN
jgi:hypothetical protein